MSDSEATMAAAPAHVHLGGKTLQSYERPKYKSWRKKYRKMRHHFDGVLEENKRLFKEEQKLDSIAKRLREELDGLLELCLDLNQNPAIPPELRFDLSFPNHHQGVMRDVVPSNIGPEDANRMLTHYADRVCTGQALPIELHAVREQVNERLAQQDAESLEKLEKSVAQPVPSADDAAREAQEEAEEGLEPIGWLSPEQEDAYLARLDAKSHVDPYAATPDTVRRMEREAPAKEEKHWAELTPREIERQAELLNPQSQHNWLKAHAKANGNLVGGDDDADSVASHDVGGGAGAVAKTSRKRTGKDKNLAKQVGDRAVERAREEFSPSAGDGADEDELAFDDGALAGRKRVRDPDGAYRVKGGKSGSSGNKGKRKRGGDDFGDGGTPGGTTSVKKAKVEGE